MKNCKAFTLVELLVVGTILFILAALLFGGVKSCSTLFHTDEVTAQVHRLYVDHDRESSHYMVGTDVGVFEVQNGLFTGIWNADELFSQLQENHTYRFKTRGIKVVNMFFQQYPYIIELQEVKNISARGGQ